MPPLTHTPIGIWGWIVLVPLVGVAITAAIAMSPVLLLAWVVGGRSLARNERRIANERKGEDIGTFARAFDRRAEPFDPWVVRATWDALQVYVRYPLRPTDRLIEDLCIDPDDIDLALLVDVAKRSRHSLAAPIANPYFAKFSTFRDVTVGDFVKLISAQPKIEQNSSSAT